MLPNRLLLLAICAAPLIIVACGGDDDDGGTVVPEGTHHGYVISKASVIPTPPHQTTDPGYALDLGSKTSATLDGRLDNQLGSALTILAGFPDLDVQGTVDTAVNEGKIMLLVDFQSKDFANSNAGFTVKFGWSPNPAACSDDNDTVCGHHLAGSATFEIAAGSPNDALLAGKLENGVFEGGPGELSLQIAIGTTDPILLPLHHARVRVTSVSATALSAIVGGLLTFADLKTYVGGSLAAPIAALVAGGCTALKSPPDCGCTGFAAQIMMIADGSDGSAKNCEVSVDELLANNVTGPSTKPDACSMETCAASDSLSVAILVDAVPATFPM